MAVYSKEHPCLQQRATGAMKNSPVVDVFGRNRGGSVDCSTREAHCSKKTFLLSYSTQNYPFDFLGITRRLAGYEGTGKCLIYIGARPCTALQVKRSILK